MKRSTAEIVAEYGPLRARRASPASPSTAAMSGSPRGGRLNALDRQSRRPRCAPSMSPAMPAPPSTAATSTRSPRPASTRSIRRRAASSPRSRRLAAAPIPALPGPRARSGSAQYRGRSIHQIDPETGRIIRTIEAKALRHRRDLGRWRTLARHLGRRGPATSAASIPRPAPCWRRSTCRPAPPCPGSNPMAPTASSPAAATAARSASSAAPRAAGGRHSGRERVLHEAAFPAVITGRCAPWPVSRPRSASGSPSTTTRSACAPAATQPILPCHADQRLPRSCVAERMTSIAGSTPAADDELLRLVAMHRAEQVGAIGHRHAGLPAAPPASAGRGGGHRRSWRPNPAAGRAKRLRRRASRR